ncbi:MAG: membrane protein insertase YidC [Candidatus Omnitrophota bacterium]
MNTEKRALYAIVISMFIVIFTPLIIAKFFPGLKQQPKVQQPAAAPVAPAAAAAPETAQPAAQVIDDKSIVFETEEYKIEFSGSCGAIKKITLKKLSDSNGLPIVMAETPGSGDAIFYTSGLSKEMDRASFTYTAKGDRAIFAAKSPDGMLVEKEYIFQPGRYAIELKQTITNSSSQSRPLKYSIVTSSGIPDLSKQDAVYVEIVRDIDGKIVNTNKKAIKKETPWDGRQVNWLSLKNRYFSLITKPPVFFTGIIANKLQDNGLQTKMSSAEFTIGPNASATHNFMLYAGPSDYDKISSLKMGMENSLYLGFTGSIGKILFVVLKFFHSLVRNWGLAIIALTAFINILLFPLTFKGIKAMKQMQALQPKIEALRKANKDNPQKTNKEVMELYKKYKINPMGGCLPMLLQMPVFFALYQVLMRSHELRGAPFLWIKDLSQPDRLMTFKGSIPLLGNDLNILPLLMAVAMFLQQKLSAPPAASQNDQMAQQQKMMGVMMPVLFGFLFYGLPSGLVMYWLTNTVLTVAEQELFLKKEMFHVEHSE